MLRSDSSPLLRLQLHGHDRVLASKAGAAALLLRVGVTHLRHLLQLQRGALRPAQHHLRQHRQNEPVPLAPQLHHHHHRFLLLFILLIQPLLLHVPAHPVPALLPRGARLLHLRAKGKWWEESQAENCSEMEDESKAESSDVMKNYWIYLPNTGHCMLREENTALTVHSMYIDHPHSQASPKDRVLRELQGRPYRFRLTFLTCSPPPPRGA